ncbi:hypothetical protein PFISCL1PPCAC_22750, partial [Pristionchus fissidentatus]
ARLVDAQHVSVPAFDLVRFSVANIHRHAFRDVSLDLRVELFRHVAAVLQADARRPLLPILILLRLAHFLLFPLVRLGARRRPVLDAFLVLLLLGLLGCVLPAVARLLPLLNRLLRHTAHSTSRREL